MRMNEQLQFLIPVTIGACEPLNSLASFHSIDVGAPGGVDRLVMNIKSDWNKRARTPRGVSKGD